MGQYQSWYITILISLYSFLFDEGHASFGQLFLFDDCVRVVQFILIFETVTVLEDFFIKVKFIFPNLC